mmetsp:Transcript_13800/g.36617  ORF Transcript_13800/g.36617 Transcript_13800/m.36617 type:complete len:257 (-) Transcript_13800:14-784(-)
MHTGEQAAGAMFQLKKIHEYMVENLDDVVQEGRWRAVMSKEMHLRHRLVLTKLGEVDQLVRQTRQTVEGKQRGGSSRGSGTSNRRLTFASSRQSGNSRQSGGSSGSGASLCSARMLKPTGPPSPTEAPHDASIKSELQTPMAAVSAVDPSIKEELHKLRSEQAEIKKLLQAILHRDLTAPCSSGPLPPISFASRQDEPMRSNRAQGRQARRVTRQPGQHSPPPTASLRQEEGKPAIRYQCRRNVKLVGAVGVAIVP